MIAILTALWIGLWVRLYINWTYSDMEYNAEYDMWFKKRSK